MSATDECCRVCGKEAEDACGGCKSALYCSKKCQKWDWSTGGHKALCRGPAINRKLNAVLRDLFASEWQWLQSLSTSERSQLFASNTLIMPLNHLFISGEVALVLARINASALLTNGRCSDEYGYEFYRKVLSPWYSKHMALLSSEGFFVELITHGVFVSDQQCQCSPYCDELFDCVRGGAALFKDTRNAKNDLVNKLFEGKRSIYLIDWKEEDKKAFTISDLNSCVCLPQPREPTVETATNISYFFQHSKQVFGGATNICCSPCFRFPSAVDIEDANAVGDHFHRSFEGLAKLGFLIELAVVHIEDYPDKALAEMWYAAAGKKSTTFHKWIDSGTVLLTKRALLTGRLSGVRLNRVVALVDELMTKVS